MAELKTKKTEQSVDAFIKKIPDAKRRSDALVIAALMEKVSKTKGKMWGTSIVGFGDRVLKYDSGRELDWFIVGFSPRKKNFALYIPGAVENQQALLKKLGKHKTGKGCLYIDALDQVNPGVLKEIISKAIEEES